MSRRTLLLLLFLKALVVCLFILFLGVGLAPDEAQYWTWSQQLDWGYYSKPPAIAWQIFLTTKLFGNTVFGVRAGAVILSFLLPLVGFSLGRKAGLEKRTSLWCGLLLAFTPFAVYLSFPATTDLGATLFLLLAISSLVGKVRYPLAGFYLMVGALYKWTAFVFWPITFIAWIFCKELRRKEVLIALGISLLALLPTLYWNISNDWATFRHVGSTVAKVGGGKGSNFFDFLAAQAGIFNPIFFVVLIISFFSLYRRKVASLIYPSLFPLALGLYLIASLFGKMQPNWALYLFPPGMLLVAWWLLERTKWGLLWLHLGLWSSILCVGFALFIPMIQENNWLPLSYKLNPFRQAVGWQKLQPALVESGYEPSSDFLFSDRYQITSLLSFYGPDQKRAYFFNLGGARRNQFTYWPGMENEVGKTGFFVLAENTSQESLSWYEKAYLERLSPYFQEVSFVKSVPLFFSQGKSVKYALIFECKNFYGSFPMSVNEF